LTPPPQFPANPPAPQSAIKGPTTILAGTVTDAYHRPLGNAHIRLVSVDAKDAAAAPIDVAADARGNFIIQGVKTGQTYKLIARSKLGEKLLAGTLLTDAPNVRAMIMVREDLVNSSTPPIPGAPAYQPDPAQGGGNNGTVLPGAEPNLPTTLTVPAAPTNAPVTKTPKGTPSIVENATDRLPMLKIPNKTPPAAPINPPKAAPTAVPDASRFDTGPTRVPSCVLVGSHVENIALKDTRGQTWEYKKQGQGKLVLLDFWYLQCMPCRETMPMLNKLHLKYASSGLEVLGISRENGVDERKEADAINRFCSSMQISYRQLLGHAGTFDAAKHFRVNAFPTMMLLSEQGDILWTHVGQPDAGHLYELERLIQSRLMKTY
jgi:thiol-disulfide isomerase/thioredoxin